MKNNWLRDKGYMGVNIFAFLEENKEYMLSFNGNEITNKTMFEIDCLESAIINFRKNVTKQDISEYNKELVKDFVLDMSKSRDKKKTLKKERGFVYIYKQDIYYKIGKSKSEIERKKRYITENPNEIDVILVIKTEDYTYLEKILHKRFSKKRYRGEWFILTDNDIKLLKNKYK